MKKGGKRVEMEGKRGKENEKRREKERGLWGRAAETCLLGHTILPTGPPALRVVGADSHEGVDRL